MNASEKKRAAIRKAAYRCFRDTGYHNTTIDSICQDAGISKGSFYWYYQSKQEIFIDILSEWSRDVVDQLYQQFQEALRQEDYVTSITDAVTRETHRGRSTVPLLIEFSAQGLREPEIRSALSAFYRRIRFAIGEMLRPVLGQRITESELEAVSATIFGAYSGLMIQDLCDPNQAGAQDTVRRFMSALRIWLMHESSSPDPRQGVDGPALAQTLEAARLGAIPSTLSQTTPISLSHADSEALSEASAQDLNPEPSRRMLPTSPGMSPAFAVAADNPTTSDSGSTLH